jgi:hypothetical protein
MKQRITIAILRALLRADPIEIPQDSLHGAAIELCKPEKFTSSEFDVALKWAEGEGWVCGVSRRLQETTWTLTDAGRHTARQL